MKIERINGSKTTVSSIRLNIGRNQMSDLPTYFTADVLLINVLPREKSLSGRPTGPHR